jgi:hypothetical protein
MCQSGLKYKSAIIETVDNDCNYHLCDFSFFHFFGQNLIQTALDSVIEKKVEKETEKDDREKEEGGGRKE